MAPHKLHVAALLGQVGGAAEQTHTTFLLRLHAWRSVSPAHAISPCPTPTHACGQSGAVHSPDTDVARSSSRARSRDIRFLDECIKAGSIETLRQLLRPFIRDRWSERTAVI